MRNLIESIVWVVTWYLVLTILVQCAPPQEKWRPVPVEYTIIEVLEDELGTKTDTKTERTMSFQPCDTDINCYEMCITNGGDPDFCEAGLMEGDE